MWGSDLDADDPPEPESRHAIQETAEIDMRTVLEAEDLAEDTPASTPEHGSSATDALPRGRIDHSAPPPTHRPRVGPDVTMDARVLHGEKSSTISKWLQALGMARPS